MILASDLLVSGTEGPGLYIAKGALSCSGCDLLNNTFAGAVAWAGGSIDLSSTTISGMRPDANEGGGIGIYMSNRLFPSSLTLDDVTIEDQPYAAVWLDGNGSYSILGSTLVAGYGMDLEYPNGTTTIQHGDAVVAANGVTAWDGTNGLLLEDNEIRDAVRAGVLLDASSATLANNSFSGNTTDLIWQDCDGVDEPGGLNDVAEVDYCPFYNHHIAPLEFNLILEDAEPLE